MLGFYQNKVCPIFLSQSDQVAASGLHTNCEMSINSYYEKIISDLFQLTKQAKSAEYPGRAKCDFIYDILKVI